MKYYLEYKDREEFNALCKHYDTHYAYGDQKEILGDYPYGFIINNNRLDWKPSYQQTPADTKKITFKEWKEMINPKLEWKKGAYVKYLGTKEGSKSDEGWEIYFNHPED